MYDYSAIDDYSFILFIGCLGGNSIGCLGEWGILFSSVYFCDTLGLYYEMKTNESFSKEVKGDSNWFYKQFLWSIDK